MAEQLPLVAQPDPLRRWIETAPREALLEELARWPAPAVLEALRARFRVDDAWFCAYAFPDLAYLPWNDAHRWLLGWFQRLPPWSERVRLKLGERDGSIEAPRGIAKTTLIKMLLAKRIVYGMERHIVWGGGNRDAAKQEAGHIREMFENPTPTLAQLYGPFLVSGGVFSWQVQVGQAPPVYVSARGFPRGVMRGLNRFGVRPTFVAADDLEHPKEVENPIIRAELTRYIKSDVRNVGPKEGGFAYLQSGTRLHPDSQTAQNARDPAFESGRFQAVSRWPDRADLWARAKALWADLTDPHREETARDFYERNRAAMDAGAQVLDDVAQPIYDLHVILWGKGEASFYKDYQQDPIDPTKTIFDPDKWPKCRFDGFTITTAEGRRVSLAACRLAWWLDPRASENIEDDDFAAFSLAAHEPMPHGGPGYSYLLKTTMARVRTEDQIAWIWAAFDRHGPGARYGYENNGFQRMIGKLLEIQREERRKAGRSWQLPLAGYTSSEGKNDRIIGLAPRISLGWIQFADDLPTEVLDQWRAIPTGTYDDAPDSGERAIWLAEDGGMATADLQATLR